MVSKARAKAKNGTGNEVAAPRAAELFEALFAHARMFGGPHARGATIGQGRRRKGARLSWVPSTWEWGFSPAEPHPSELSAHERLERETALDAGREAAEDLLSSFLDPYAAARLGVLVGIDWTEKGSVRIEALGAEILRVAPVGSIPLRRGSRGLAATFPWTAAKAALRRVSRAASILGPELSVEKPDADWSRCALLSFELPDRDGASARFGFSSQKDDGDEAGREIAAKAAMWLYACGFGRGETIRISLREGRPRSEGKRPEPPANLVAKIGADLDRLWRRT